MLDMQQILNDLREVTVLSITLRVVLSIILGGILGVDRELKNRPAGLRTYMLVSLGACVVSITNQYATQIFQISDPVRMSAQVISGIGFLGAGTIIVTRRNQIKGLTTAAGLWACACIGISIGIGFYEIALIAGFSSFIILTALHKIDVKLKKNTRSLDLYIELKKTYSIRRFLKYVHEQELISSNMQIEDDNIPIADTVAFIITLRGLKKITHDDILIIVKSFPGMRYFEEL